MPYRSACRLAAIALLALLAACAGRAPAPPTAEGTVGHGIFKVGQPYQINGVWYYPAEDYSYDETGIASWYGEDFHGKYTANGEVFDLNALTAAHRTLPMPSIVEVTNLENGRSIELRVNDRGPYARGRIIDVSRRAAQLLGFEGKGTAKVRVRILVPESIQAASLEQHGGGVVEAGQAAPVMPVVTEPLVEPRLVANQPTTRPPQPPPAPAPAPVVAAAPAPVVAAAPAPVVAAAPALPGTVAVVPVKPTQIYIQAGAFAVATNAAKVKSRIESLGAVRVVGARVNGVDLYRVRLGPLGTVDEADRLLDRVIAAGLTEARIVVD
jgi:rare lipoprotein A